VKHDAPMCPSCNTPLRWDGYVLTSNPPQYKHVCPICKFAALLRTRPQQEVNHERTLDTQRTHHPRRLER
jgi:RNA polymerase subunit RPABC4/transcription elongation factor Spt4